MSHNIEMHNITHTFESFIRNKYYLSQLNYESLICHLRSNYDLSLTAYPISLSGKGLLSFTVCYFPHST